MAERKNYERRAHRMDDENNTGIDEVTTVKDSEQTETESTSAASTDETATGAPFTVTV